MLFILSAKTNSYADLNFFMFMKILGLAWNCCTVPLLVCLYGLVNYSVLTFHLIFLCCFSLFFFIHVPDVCNCHSILEDLMHL